MKLSDAVGAVARARRETAPLPMPLQQEQLPGGAQRALNKPLSQPRLGRGCAVSTSHHGASSCSKLPPCTISLRRNDGALPRSHRHVQGVASTIVAAATGKPPLNIEQLGVRRPAVPQQRGSDVSPISAGRTGRDDHVPWAQNVHPQRITRRHVPRLFHSARATPEQARKQG